MFDESKRQRAMRPEVKISREALRVVQPINRRIGTWQTTIVRLGALGRRPQAADTYREKIRAEAEALAAEVKTEAAVFQEALQSLPDAVAKSSRLADTCKALSSLMSGIEGVLTDLPQRSDIEPTV